jgi:tRNA(Ile)-lysidine synthase
MHQSKFEVSLSNIIGAAPSRAALAISGGSDSIALLHLATYWAKREKVQLVVMHVDHNLRDSSAQDAKFVQEIAQSLGHDFHLLPWRRAYNITSAIQEKAREVRYDMMTTKCLELGIQLLMTAHHFDDMIENYLMRKSRGSGVLGLSYSYSYFVNDVRIIRPLLEFKKELLQNYLQQNQYSWVEDETNISDKYERNRVRKELGRLSDHAQQVIVDDMHRVNQEAQILNQHLINFLAEFVQIDRMGFCIMQMAEYKNLQYDLQIQVLSYLLTITSGKAILPRFRNIQPIIEKIQQNIALDCTLHGCLLASIDASQLLICREKSQISVDFYPLVGNVRWDHRFAISAKITNHNYKVTAFSQEAYSSIKEKIDMSCIARVPKIYFRLILFTLPVITHLEKIVAIPHISYYDEKILENNLQIIFKPNFVSRFTHFL